MARKSRRLQQLGITVPKIYRVAAYLRISKQKDNGYHTSIENQQAIIEDYVNKEKDMVLYNIYIDEGVSGRTFDRAGFNAMIKDIEKKKIDCVIVKDFSRFGRDYIKVSYYLQMYFPKNNIRFVSISNDYDSTTGNMSLGEILKTLVDEEYSKDIGRKVESTIRANHALGNYNAPRAPYGYKKSKENKHQLVVDTTASLIVKKIFQLFLEGMSLNDIVKSFNEEKVSTPIQYALQNGLEGNYDQGNGLWNTRSVKSILTNRVYMGDLLHKPTGNITRNTHEAIVSEFAFKRVGQILEGTAKKVCNTTNQAREDNLLRGKVTCACCGGKMQRRKGSGKADWNFFTCITKNRLGEEHCSGMYVREPALLEVLMKEIRSQVKLDEKYLEAEKARYKKAKSLHDKLEIDNVISQRDLKNLFEKLIHNELTAEEFKEQKNSISPYDEEIDKLQKEMETYLNCLEYNTLLADSLKNEEALKKVIADFVEKIVVNEDKIEMIWKE